MKSVLVALVVVASSLAKAAVPDAFPAPPPPPSSSSPSQPDAPQPAPTDLPLPPPPPDGLVPPPPNDAITGAVPPKEPRPSTPDKQHRFSLTFSVPQLILPMFEVTGEFRLTDKMGLAAVLGGGAATDRLTGYTYGAFDAGAQYRYYVVGTFIHGMDLGAQAKLLLLTDGYSTYGGFSLTPFVGYKIATNIGFTFDAQLGPEFTLAGATATLVRVDALAQGAVGLFLNLNVGWSF